MVSKDIFIQVNNGNKRRENKNTKLAKLRGDKKIVSLYIGSSCKELNVKSLNDST